MSFFGGSKFGGVHNKPTEPCVQNMKWPLSVFTGCINMILILLNKYDREYEVALLAFDSK